MDNICLCSHSNGWEATEDRRNFYLMVQKVWDVLEEVQGQRDAALKQPFLQFGDLSSPEVMNRGKKSFTGDGSFVTEGEEDFPEILKTRPQRENRRYLLWRKITGKK